MLHNAAGAPVLLLPLHPHQPFAQTAQAALQLLPAASTVRIPAPQVSHRGAAGMTVDWTSASLSATFEQRQIVLEVVDPVSDIPER
ncbi:MAG: hypothetical protein AAGI15_03470 [Pseudomonadota bacterium]